MSYDEAMIYLFMCLFIGSNSFAGTNSINPERMVLPLIDIFSPRNQLLGDGRIKASVSIFDEKGEIYRHRSSHIMSELDFTKAKNQSRAVYPMIPIESQVYDSNYEGTAFHIGKNLVLTNHHVLSLDRESISECRNFQLQDQENDFRFDCKKVLHCDYNLDICLIEMSPFKRCLNLFCTKKEFIYLSDGASLKLKTGKEVDPFRTSEQIMTAIGNTMGLGIHYSQGRGVQRSADRTIFYAPVRTGNSGGPLIGEDGLVWGVVKQESSEKVSNDSFNVAASIDYVIQSIQLALEQNPKYLQIFEQALKE